MSFEKLSAELDKSPQKFGFPEKMKTVITEFNALDNLPEKYNLHSLNEKFFFGPGRQEWERVRGEMFPWLEK